MTHLIMVIFLNGQFLQVAEGEKLYRSHASCDAALVARGFGPKSAKEFFREFRETRPSGEYLVRALCQTEGQLPK